MIKKKIIGKTDKIDFPDWGLKKIPVKIDTGAYRSSIDCSFIKVIIKNKVKTLQYILLNEDTKQYNKQVFETKEFKTSKVKSSNGQVEKRYVVKGVIKIFNQLYTTEFTLSTRNDMKFPVLIGRKLLNNNFIVDTSKSNLSYKFLKRGNGAKNSW